MRPLILLIIYLTCVGGAANHLCAVLNSLKEFTSLIHGKLKLDCGGDKFDSFVSDKRAAAAVVLVEATAVAVQNDYQQ